MALTVQNLFEKLTTPRSPEEVIDIAVNTGMGQSPFQVLEALLFLMQLLQLTGLGMAVSGATMLAYGLLVKKENR